MIRAASRPPASGGWQRQVDDDRLGGPRAAPAGRLRLLEILEQVACRLVPARRLFLQAPHDDVGEERREIGRHFFQWARRDPDALHEHFERRVPWKRCRSRRHLVEDQPERVQIAPMIARLSFNGLGRHVTRCPDEVAGPREPRGARLIRLRQAEVRDVRAARQVDEDVLGLQIAMHDPDVVGGGKTRRDLTRERQHALERQVS